MNILKGCATWAYSCGLYIALLFICTILLNLINLMLEASYTAGKLQVVIARYNENLSWAVDEFGGKNIDVVVYNKGEDNLDLPPEFKVIKLPNIGREAHTYLYHIVNNYEHLADRTVFLQGYPYDHRSSLLIGYVGGIGYGVGHSICKNIRAFGCRETTLKKERDTLTSEDWKSTKWHNTRFSNGDIISFTREVLKYLKLVQPIYFTYGAQFAVDKKRILARDKGYYEAIMRTLDNVAPIEGHYLERLWDVVFDGYYNHYGAALR